MNRKVVNLADIAKVRETPGNAQFLANLKYVSWAASLQEGDFSGKVKLWNTNKPVDSDALASSTTFEFPDFVVGDNWSQSEVDRMRSYKHDFASDPPVAGFVKVRMGPFWIGFEQDVDGGDIRVVNNSGDRPGLGDDPPNFLKRRLDEYVNTYDVYQVSEWFVKTYQKEISTIPFFKGFWEPPKRAVNTYASMDLGGGLLGRGGGSGIIKHSALKDKSDEMYLPPHGWTTPEPSPNNQQVPVYGFIAPPGWYGDHLHWNENLDSAGDYNGDGSNGPLNPPHSLNSWATRGESNGWCSQFLITAADLMAFTASAEEMILRVFKRSRSEIKVLIPESLKNLSIDESKIRIDLRSETTGPRANPIIYNLGGWYTVGSSSTVEAKELATYKYLKETKMGQVVESLKIFYLD